MTHTLHKLLLFGTLLLSTVSLVHAQHQDPAAQIVDIAKLDRTMNKHKAKPRRFKTKEEFRRTQLRRQTHTQREKKAIHKRIQAHTKQMMPHTRSYRHGNHSYRDDDMSGYDERYYRPMIYGKPHRYTKRGWVLAYRYDRAEFYDREGFHYGYFNRYGYMFEGEFYRYDRYYTYRDRIKGRGLFDRYFYAPAQWRYYGFCR